MNAMDAGIRFIDTANVYAGGESERIVGHAVCNLGIRRDDLVVGTKLLGRRAWARMQGEWGSPPNREQYDPQKGATAGVSSEAQAGMR